MSRGPGRWQRMLLDALAEDECVAVVGRAWQALGRPTTRAEEVALRRAAKALVMADQARAIYLRLPVAGGTRRTPQLVLTRPDSNVRGEFFSADRHPDWVEWVDGTKRAG